MELGLSRRCQRPLPQRTQTEVCVSPGTLTFDHPGAALSASNGRQPASFEIAGADNGWQPFSTGNVVNAAGRPLSTFQISIAP